MKKVLTLVVFLGLLSACASNRLTSEEREKLFADYLTEIKAESQDRIRAFRFYGWQELGHRHLILSTSPKRKYFITLRGPCFELPFTTTIGIHRTDSSLNAKFDSIFVPSIPEQRCHIKTIHKITDEQADQIVALEKQATKEKKLEMQGKELQATQQNHLTESSEK